jgi:TRAP-type C4-dicarboxylate transport system substrate-binding protein
MGTIKNERKDKPMKKLFPIMLMIAVVVALVIGGCAKETPAPTPTATQATTTAPATTTPTKPMELIFSCNTPASAPMCQDEQKCFDLITERSGGRVTFTCYWSSTLIPDDESWNGMLSGVCDLLHWVASEDYQRLNWGIMNMPFIGWPSMEVGAEINLKLIDKFPEMKEEFKGVGILGIRMMPPVQIHTIKKPVKVPEDLKGMKIICTGAMAKFVNLVGGVPCDIQPGDMYTALNSGLAEGNINHWPVVSVFGTLPLYNYHTNFGDGGIQMLPMGIVANPQSWAKIPADIQKIMIDTYQEICVTGGYAMDRGEIEKYTKEAEDAGHMITYLTPEEIKVWQDACTPLHNEWLNEFESEGKPAKAVYAEAKRLIAEYAQK